MARIRLAAGIVFGLLLLVATRAQSDGVKQIAPGVYFWQGDADKREPANCTWIVFKDYVLVIDANYPWGTREIMPKIKSTTSKPIRFLFDTHWHSDHTFGNSLYADAGATIVCSQDCADELRTRGPAAWSSYNGTGEYSLQNYRLEQATLTFPDKMAFDDGNERVEITHMGPGHTKGDAVAYLPKEKILVTGDLCVNWNRGNNVADSSADPENWVRVLDQLAKWDIKTVVPGHGGVGDLDTLRQQREYLADMVSQVRAGIQAGKTADQVASGIDLSKHGTFGANAQANSNSARAVYRKLSAARN